jgi:CSLREA domain-containing protein
MAMLASLAALLCSAPAATAAIKVTTTADVSLAGDGACSLREAILAVNGTAESDCPGSSSPAVTLVSLPAGTYHLSSPLQLSGPVALQGAGDPSQTVLSADGIDQVLTVSSSQASLSGVTITAGRSTDSAAPGGALSNTGTLTISNSLVAGNVACGGGGGIFNSGALVLSMSTVSGNRTGDPVCADGSPGDGGGILNRGALSVLRSTISDNQTAAGGSGGGIASESPVSIAASTIARNQAGGVAINASGRSAIVNSTFALNTGGAISVLQGTTSISSSTIAGNSGTSVGGIEVDPSASVSEQNTLVASNAPINCSGPVTDAGSDLSFPEASCPHAVSGNPNLGPLAGYGGPTPVLALTPGSAAIDTGAGCASTDQRGVVRPQGSACDIGAYEYAPPVCRAVASATHATRPVLVQLSCGDPAGLAVQYVLIGGARHGRLSGLGKANGRVTYTAKRGFAGRDQFTFGAVNANGTSSTQVASVSVAPVPLAIVGARVTPAQFRAGQGTKFLFTLAAAAQVKIAITRPHGEESVRSVSARGKAGANSVRFSGRGLAPGRYEATLVANADGSQSAPVSLSFVIQR